MYYACRTIVFYNLTLFAKPSSIRKKACSGQHTTRQQNMKSLTEILKSRR